MYRRGIVGVFKPTDTFKKGIENGENGYLRRTLGNLIFTDRSFNKNIFDDALKYVKEQIGNDIYEEYNNNGLISDGKSSFTEDDFGEAVAKLKNNFCKERIEDVKKISKMVYGNKSDEVYNQSNEESKKKQVVVRNKEEKITPIYWAILAVGAVVTIAVIITVIKVMKE